MATLSEDYVFFIEQFGRPVGGGPLDQAAIDKYRGKLPADLLDFWAQAGTGLVLDGYFQLCDPRRYAPLVERMFAGDADLDPARLHMLGYSALGSILLWHEVHRGVRVRLPIAEVIARDLLKGPRALPPERSLGTELTSIDQAANDLSDSTGKGLFKRALKKLGPLKTGQVYGFKLALPLGGERSLDNLAILEAYEHFSIRADLEALRLIDYATMPPRFVRTIGRP